MVPAMMWQPWSLETVKTMTEKRARLQCQHCLSCSLTVHYRLRLGNVMFAGRRANNRRQPRFFNASASTAPSYAVRFIGHERIFRLNYLKRLLFVSSSENLCIFSKMCLSGRVCCRVPLVLVTSYTITSFASLNVFSIFYLLVKSLYNFCKPNFDDQPLIPYQLFCCIQQCHHDGCYL